MDGGNVDTSASAALLSEGVMRLVEGIESADSAQLSGQLPGDDESLRALVEALPRLANAAALAFNSLAGSVERLDADEAAELVSTLISQVDGARLGEAINSISRVVILLYESDPELFARGGMEPTSGAIEAIDFGKLRKYLTYRARARTEYRRQTIAAMGKEPVALINLAGLLPEFVNNALALLNQLLDIVKFPPEAITYAVLHLMEEVRWDELSRALNGTFRLVDSLQRGNLLLGDGSSRIADVMDGVSEDFIRDLDFRGASRAMSAICDNLEPTVTSLLTAALQTEDGALAVTGAVLSLANLSIRTASEALGRVAALPPELIVRMSGGLSREFASRELGAAINSAVVLFNRSAFEAPELVGAVLGGVVSGIDPAEAALAGKNLAAGLGEALREGPGGDGTFWPQAFAATANNAMASFNRLSDEDPELVTRSLDEFLGGLDEKILADAARNASSRLADAALRRPGIASALARALLSAAFKFVKGHVRGIWTERGKGVR